PGFYRSAAQLPYVSRLALERWHDTERARIEHWELGDISEKLLILVELLNSKTPDPQKVVGWLDANREAITVDALMTLVSESRIRGFTDAMRAKSDKKTATKNKKHKEVAYRWLQYEAG